jgi:hypothetical protein
MKKLTTILCLLGAVFYAQSQSLKFGVKAGLNFSEMSNKNALYSGTSSATGFVGGVYGHAGILGFFVRPEVLFSQRKGAFTSTVDQTAVINTLNYIDIPVLVGYKLAFARFNFGPNFQFLASAKQKATQAAKDQNFSKDNFNESAIGFQAGVGVDVAKLSIDLRYDGNFNNLGKEVVTAAGNKIDYSTRASMWQLTLGFKIF